MISNIKYPTNKLTSRMTNIELARLWANRRGLIAQEGGWLCYKSDTDPYPVAMVQGYSRLAGELEDRGVIKVGAGIDWQKGEAINLRTLRAEVMAALAAQRKRTRASKFGAFGDAR